MKYYNLIKILFMLCLLIAIVAFSVWSIVYSFHDCLNVGHTLTYCWLNL